MVRVLSILCATVALLSTTSMAKKANSFQQYTVSCDKTYIVKNGDTCSVIDKAFGLNFKKLRTWNPSINSRCTNLYIDQVLCLSPPVVKSSDINTGVTSTKKSKKTSKKTKPNQKKTTKPSKKTKKPKTTTVMTMPHSKVECKTNDDCPGVRCCNLFTNKCVLDPKGTICDIMPTTTIVKTTVSAHKTVTTKVTVTNTAPPVATTTATSSGRSGLTVQISSSSDFCLLLPSSPGNRKENNGKLDIDAIANSEKSAITFCTKPNINAPGAGVFPAGFIKHAKYQTNSAAGFVQVRGTLDISAYELSPKDEGGQYDDHGKGSPPKSSCAGYPYYVSLIEPSTADFCIRCCESYSDCHAGRSAYGCDRVVPEL
ncbi:hypothetical protein BY458DRAFT_503088 [Sporodiniella umbellata]|nr:hypothetical protein BY458DRAFT_503088 [Sporodiniella umbellata]